MSAPLQEDLTLLTRPLPEPPPASSWVWLWVLAAAAALAIGFWLARRRTVATEVVVWSEPPDAVALRALATLLAAGELAHARAAVGEISGILRRYVEARFGVRAPTLTTEEFLSALRDGRALPPQFAPFWRSFLDESDAVTYAGRSADLAQVRRLAAAAGDFVRAAAKTEVRGA